MIGLLATLYLQRKELGYQRRELRLTRKELALTRDEVKKSVEAQQNSERALASQSRTLMLSARLNSVSAILNVYENRHSSAISRGVQGDIRIAELNREKHRMSLEALGEELIFVNQCEVYSPIFAIIPLANFMTTRIKNEVNFIQRNYYDDYQFMSLYNSVLQQIHGAAEFAKNIPFEIRKAISQIFKSVIMFSSELQLGTRTNSEIHFTNCKVLIKQIEELKSISENLLEDESQNSHT